MITYALSWCSWVQVDILRRHMGAHHARATSLYLIGGVSVIKVIVIVLFLCSACLLLEVEAVWSVISGFVYRLLTKSSWEHLFLTTTWWCVWIRWSCQNISSLLTWSVWEEILSTWVHGFRGCRCCSENISTRWPLDCVHHPMVCVSWWIQTTSACEPWRLPPRTQFCYLYVILCLLEVW